MFAGINNFRDYALLKDPKTIEPSTLLKFSDTTITIFDKFPKATFHFLILPRIREGLTAKDLHDLKSLLQKDKAAALRVLKELETESQATRRMMVDEMHRRFGESCEWEIFVGFHAVPSMHHLHLHVISSDYVAPALKKKQHWNSFHPKLGFFIELKDVISWFELSDKDFAERAKLPSSEYEPILKGDLQCWKCDETLKTMPKLKEHLKAHFDKELAARKKKRKVEIDLTIGEEEENKAKVIKT